MNSPFPDSAVAGFPNSAKHDANYSAHCKEAISALYKNGIALFGGYINFNPATTINELEQSVKFLRDGREAANFTNLSQGLRLYEGTRICQTYPEQAKYHDILDGEFFYRFHHPEAQRIYEHLAQVKTLEGGLMGRIDLLNYEITDVVYLNQMQDTRCGAGYFEAANKRNLLNCEYFLGLCSRSKAGTRLGSDQQEFIRESARLERQYQEVYQDLKGIVGNR